MPVPKWEGQFFCFSCLGFLFVFEMDAFFSFLSAFDYCLSSQKFIDWFCVGNRERRGEWEREERWLAGMVLYLSPLKMMNILFTFTFLNWIHFFPPIRMGVSKRKEIFSFLFWSAPKLKFLKLVLNEWNFLQWINRWWLPKKETI